MNNNTEDSRKSGTRIFKKSTPNGKLTVYLGKRDFIDHLTHVDPIEGVVLLDPAYVKDRKVFVHLLGAFRCGRDDTDLLDLFCQRDLYLSTKQVYPPPLSFSALSEVNSATNGVAQTSTTAVQSIRRPPLEPPTLTRLQERLIRKLGGNAYPFYFQLPAFSPASVTLLLSASDGGKPCRVDYELKVYVADDEDQKPQKRNSVRLAIRKLTYAAPEPGPQPSSEISRDFLMSVGSLRIEVSLDKQNYYHGETIAINVLVDNNSNKTVKRIKLTVRQYTQVYVHHMFCYKCSVAEIQSDEGFPIHPSQTGWCKVYHLCPSSNNGDKMGLAMDGDLKHEHTNLASSTINPEQSSRDQVGIIVKYKVKVRFVLGFGVSDVCLELPFILTHPNPEADDQLNSTNLVPVPSGLAPTAPAALLSSTDLLDRNSRPTGAVNTREGSCAIATRQQTLLSLTLSNGHILRNGSRTESTDNTFSLPDLFRQPSAVQTCQYPSHPFQQLHFPSSKQTPPIELTKPTQQLANTSSWLTSVSTSLPQGTECANTITDVSAGLNLLSDTSMSDVLSTATLPHRGSTADTTSTLSEDDLSFEDFARLRLITSSNNVPFASHTVESSAVP